MLRKFLRRYQLCYMSTRVAIAKCGKNECTYEDAIVVFLAYLGFVIDVSLKMFKLEYMRLQELPKLQREQYVQKGALNVPYAQ